MKEGLLRIDIQLTVSLVCVVQNLVDASSEVIEYLHVFLEERGLADAQSYLLEHLSNLVGLWLQLEEVSVGESVDSSQSLLVAINFINFEVVKECLDFIVR